MDMKLNLANLAMCMILAIVAGIGASALSITTSSPSANSYNNGSITITAATDTPFENLTFFVMNGSTQIFTQTFTNASNGNATTSLNDGSYTIIINATDNASSVQNSINNIIVDSTAPVVAINSPTSTSPAIFSTSARDLRVNYTYTEQNVATINIMVLSGTIEEENNIYTDAQNGSGITRSDNISSILSTLRTGNYTINVTITDRTGKSASAIQTGAIMIGSGNPPELTVTYPSSSNIEFANSQLSMNFTYAEDNPTRMEIKFIDHLGNMRTTTITDIPAGNQTVGRTIGVPSGISEGLCGLNITLFNNLGMNTTVSITNATYVDKTDPEITSFQIVPNAFATGGQANPVCNVSDASTDYGGTINTTITGIDTLQQGHDYAFCYATDLAGNVAQATADYYVTSTSSNTTVDNTSTINITIATSNSTNTSTSTTSSANSTVQGNTTNSTQPAAANSNIQASTNASKEQVQQPNATQTKIPKISPTNLKLILTIASFAIILLIVTLVLARWIAKRPRKQQMQERPMPQVVAKPIQSQQQKQQDEPAENYVHANYRIAEPPKREPDEEGYTEENHEERNQI